MNDAMFKAVGGRPVVPQRLMGTVRAVADLDPQDVAWNFGVKEKPENLKVMIQAKPSLHQMFPKLVGAWDGNTTINHCRAVEKAGVDLQSLIQQQPRGTCGGRAGSGLGDFVQCILIAAGKRAKFHRVSHAAVYFMARKLYNMLEGNWQNDDNDGVASGSVPEALKKLGAAQREEANDANWYGAGSDDLACQLGAGMHPELQRKILEAASDNLITEWAPARSAQELSDGIAAGGIGIVSDDQGFQTSRDSQGFCRPQGTWYHYHLRISVGKFGGGRKGFGYFQSWGKGNPGGPGLEGHPGNCFGVDWDVQDRICKKGDCAVAFGFPLWELEEGKVDISWMF